MVSDWIKFLRKQKKEVSQNIRNAIFQILSHDFDWLDIKQMEWKKWYFRCRVWKIRILFYIENGEYIIDKIWFRWDIYK